jgi:hypothetical protein
VTVAMLVGWLAPAAAQADTTGPVATLSTTSITFPDTYMGDTSPVSTVTVTNTGDAVLTLDGGQITPNVGFFGTPEGTCFGNVSLDPWQSCTIDVVATPKDFFDAEGDLQILNNSAHTGLVHLSVHVLDPTKGLYFPTQSTRILDTRSGLGATKRPVKGGTAIAVQVAGKSGVPATGVSAVVLTLTVTHPTSGGFVSAYPGGTTRPGVSSVNFAAGWTGANLVTVPVGSNGKVNLYNASGTVDLIADLQGWYASSKSISPSYGEGGAYLPSEVPIRVMDTRKDGGVHHPLAAGEGVEVAVGLGNALPVNQIHALTISLTATGVHATGYLTATDLASDPTRSSTLNLHPGVTTGNMAIVPVTECSESWCTDPSGGAVVVFGVYNGSSGSTDVLVDVAGAYVHDFYSELRFHTLAPTRIVDTRIKKGTTTLGPAESHNIYSPSSVADDDTRALAANVTAISPTASTFLTLWPTGDRPNASIMNPKAGTTVAVGSTIATTDYLRFFIYNSAGKTNVLVDVSGGFDIFPSPTGSTPPGLLGGQSHASSALTELPLPTGRSGPRWFS